MWGGIPVAASNASTSDRSPLDNNINILHPVLVHELAQEFVVAIAAGYAHFVALSRDGKIFTW
jgi:alpha-tubulin suppressor-like RCC1 family protein